MSPFKVIPAEFSIATSTVTVFGTTTYWTPASTVYKHDCAVSGSSPYAKVDGFIAGLSTEQQTTTTTTIYVTQTSTNVQAQGTTEASSAAVPNLSPRGSASPANDTSLCNVKESGPRPYVSCGILNRKGNTFALRTHVLFPYNGDNNSSRFENLYIQSTKHDAAPSFPVLSTDEKDRGQFYYDASSTSVAMWHGGCVFSGLMTDVDHNMDEWSPVFIQEAAGTPRMSIEENQLVWLNDHFGAWLVCEDKKTKKFTLGFWDVTTNQGIDVSRCAKVQLLTEFL